MENTQKKIHYNDFKESIEICRGPLNTIFLFEVQILYGLSSEVCYF